MKYLSFPEARSFVRRLGLKSSKEWRKYCISGKRPSIIPTSPDKKYGKEWVSWGDWLGTENISTHKIKYREFIQAKKYVRSLGITTIDGWKLYCKSGKKPHDIPSKPYRVYKKEWRKWFDWLGSPPLKGRRYKTFEEARKRVHNLNLGSLSNWLEFCKSGNKPQDIPSNPAQVYSNDWISYGDWLGTGRIADKYRKYRKFEEARWFIQTLGLKGVTGWKNFSDSGKKPEDIPAKPYRTYKKNWISWGDWLGTGNIAFKNRTYKTFPEAKEYVHHLSLKNYKEWKKYCGTGAKPKDIPNNPDHSYRTQWIGWGDWLGTGNIAFKDRVYRNFEEARYFVRQQKLKNYTEWKNYCRSNNKPDDIPNSPDQVYDEKWISLGDWLGTGTVATRERKFRKFEDARILSQSLGLRNQIEWAVYTTSRKKPSDIPSSPPTTYKKEWAGWPDWLGNEEKTLTVRKVKELLRDLIKSKVIYQWDEAVLYSFLLRKGLLNLTSNRHSAFFKSLITASRTQEGKKLIEQYANSTSESPPDLSDFSKENINDINEIQIASTTELSNLTEDIDPLDYGNIESVDRILQNTNILESINVDEEAMQFYLNYSIDELWKSAFQDEKKTVQKINEQGHNGNKYHDTIIDTFLRDYEESRVLKLPDNYSLQYLPKLMQLYVAYKINNLPYFGNFSGTGAGKTLSAIIASRIMRSKITVIVCPNDVVEQWKMSIMQTFPDSKIVTGKDAFYIQYHERKYQYGVINYDKFSQEDSPNLILNLAKQRVDFVILDEVHFTKIRDEEKISQRRANLDGLLTAIRKNNPQVRVLGLSATPVVNNLREGRSLLELITGKIYEDVAIKPTIPNAVTLYEKLSTISIRELPNYNVKTNTHFIEVEAQRPRDISIKQLKSNPLAIEKFLTDARIPEIIKNIDGQTIIYTEYVEDIIEKLSIAVDQAGYSYALYTGSDRSGLARFLDKKVQVLIASRPISVGVDRLQHICNRLIINTLPWTNAQYQQLLGRLVRMGQIRDVVHIYVIKASVAGYQYDELKWKRIQFKRTLADCAVDGVLPERNLVTPQQAAMEAVRWLERLERGEISTVVRRDLNVELAPVEIRKRIAKFGDFSKLNNRINNENSETTHHRMVKDPTEWEEYHRQYREARKTWGIIPYEEIVKRIKQLSPRLMIGDFGCGEAKIH